MRLFDEYRVKVTCFACGVALERNPEVGQWMQESGHEPYSQGWRWSEHWLFSREEERQHLQWVIEPTKITCGERPLGWHCRYGPSALLKQVLKNKKVAVH
jgi:allantoinase